MPVFLGPVASIVLLLCGTLAASSVIVASKPNAAELIGKIRPYQDGLGVASLIIGVIMLLEMLLHLGWFRLGPLLVYLGVSGVQIGLGILLGYGIISRLGNAKTAHGVDEWRGKLLVYQVPLGFAGIVLGVMGILLWL